MSQSFFHYETFLITIENEPKEYDPSNNPSSVNRNVRTNAEYTCTVKKQSAVHRLVCKRTRETKNWVTYQPLKNTHLPRSSRDYTVRKLRTSVATAAVAVSIAEKDNRVLHIAPDPIQQQVGGTHYYYYYIRIYIRHTPAYDRCVCVYSFGFLFFLRPIVPFQWRCFYFDCLRRKKKFSHDPRSSYSIVNGTRRAALPRI